MYGFACIKKPMEKKGLCTFDVKMLTYRFLRHRPRLRIPAAAVHMYLLKMYGFYIKKNLVYVLTMLKLVQKHAQNIFLHKQQASFYSFIVQACQLFFSLKQQSYSEHGIYK